MWTFEKTMERANQVQSHCDSLGYHDIKVKVSIKAWPGPECRGIVLAEGRCVWTTTDKDGLTERFYDSALEGLATRGTGTDG